MRRLVQRLRLLPGWVRLRRSALFDAQWYRDSYPDLGSRTDPVWHYLTHGAGEGRDPGPLFSTSGYLLQTDPGTMPALLHYETHRRAADHAGGSPAALPVFVGTAPPQRTRRPPCFFLRIRRLATSSEPSAACCICWSVPLAPD